MWIKCILVPHIKCMISDNYFESLDSRCCSRKQEEWRQTELQKHSSPSTVMKYGILLQNLRNIFRKKETHSSTMKTDSYTTIPQCSTLTPVSFHLTSHSCAFISIHSKSWCDILVRTFWTVGLQSILVITLDWNRTHTHSSVVFWDAIKSETWLRLPQACLEFEVKQCWVTLPIAVAPSHFQPAMSTGPASWNAGAAATHGDQSCGSALSAVSLS